MNNQKLQFLFSILLSLILIGSLTACGQEKENTKNTDTPATPTTISEESDLEATEEATTPTESNAIEAEAPTEPVSTMEAEVYANRDTVTSLGSLNNTNSIYYTTNELSPEEIATFTEWIQTDCNYGFAMSQYSDPTYMVADEVDYCFEGGTETLGLSEQELGELFRKYNGEENETDVTMYTTQAFDAYLTKWAGITTADLKHYNKRVYAPQYELHFSEHGDTNYLCFTCTAGSKNEDGSYSVYFQDRTTDLFSCNMTLMQEGDHFVVKSNQLLSCGCSDADQNHMGDYIFPHSNCSYLSEEDLAGMGKDYCRIARNEIFARHGFSFRDQRLMIYFSQFDWYEPLYTAEEFSMDTMLSDIERANAHTIEQYERTMGFR